MADWTPQSRAEEILFKTINGEPYDGLPQSRIEELLLELKEVIEQGGGGGGGTDNYNSLKNLPQINGQTVKGNMSGTTLGLVNMVMGKDLSTNDYTNADKAIVNSVTADLADKVDKVIGKGLSENDYTDADKAIVDGVTTALAGKVDTSLVGSANGVAELDANGRVPSSQLPSYVDDVLEYADLAHFPATGETGKIYIAEDTNKTYRWSGSDYAEISESLALGETSSTAYAGNKGKANADAIAGIKNGTSINSFSAVETALQSCATKAYVEGLTALHDIGADYDFADLTAEQKVTWFTNWTDNVNFPVLYGSGVLIPSKDPSQKGIIYVIIGSNGNGEVYTNAYRNGAWGKWNGPGLTYGIYIVNDATDVKDFIKKAIQQAHTDLANKKAYTLYNIFVEYIGNDNYYGTVERQDTAGYAFSLSKASGDNIYQGYYDISSDRINVIRFDGTAI